MAFPDSTFGNESFAGIPFIFLLRDILQFDATYTDTINRIQGANRTCDLILGVGDGKNGGAFRGFEYSASVAVPMNDVNQEPLADWHPRIPSMTYWGMDWLCPCACHTLPYVRLPPPSLSAVLAPDTFAHRPRSLQRGARDPAAEVPRLSDPGSHHQ